MRNNKEKVEGDGSSVVVLPVINVRRGKMWKQRQAAWLFHHVGINAKALLFSEEVCFYVYFTTCSFIFILLMFVPLGAQSYYIKLSVHL